MSITQQQALEALNYLHEVHGFQEDYEPLATLRQYIEQGAGADVVPWGEVREGRDGELAIFTPNFNSRLAAFTYGGDSGLDTGEILYRAAPQPQQEQP